MTERSARMTAGNAVGLIYLAWASGAAIGIFLGAGIGAMADSPAWARGVFATCFVLSALLAWRDRRRELSDLRPYGHVLVALLLLLGLYGVMGGGGGDGWGYRDDFDVILADLVRVLLVYGGLVFLPVVALSGHVGISYERWSRSAIEAKRTARAE